MKQFSVAVIGLGQIGQGYDYNSTDNTLVLTHANGFIHHEGYELIAGVDTNRIQRERFKSKFGRPAYKNVQMLMSNHQPEIYSIAVPTQEHYTVFHEVIFAKPLAVLCEKPIATCVSDAVNILAMAEKNHCALLINYIRRFEPGVLTLKQVLQNKDFGDIYKGSVWYSKGILNNGSHFVDLLRFLFGEVTQIRMIQKGRKWDGIDPEPDLCLNFGELPVYFLSAREEYYSIGEIALMGTRGMISYGQSGSVIATRKVRQDQIYPCYTILDQVPGYISTDLNRYQWHVLDHLYRHLTINTPLNSDGKSATETLKIIEDIVNGCKGVHYE